MPIQSRVAQKKLAWRGLNMPSRAERLRFLKKHILRDPLAGKLFPGGIFAAGAYEEAQQCYLSGCYIAAVLLAQIVLEHSLAAAFYDFAGRDVARTGFYRLLREARAKGWISDEECQAFDAIRVVRNEYTHGADGYQAWMERRVGAGYSSVNEMWEREARAAVSAMLRFARATL